jgi:hypothetical protein
VVFQVVSFPQVFPLKPCMHLSSPPYVPHVPPISVFSTWSPVTCKSCPATGLSRPLGIQKVKAPDFLDFRHYEGAKVVTLTHRPSLLPGVFLVLIFRGWVDPRAHGSVVSLGKNPQRHHWGSIRRRPD